MSFRLVAKVDKNQPELIKTMRALGATVYHTHQLKNFCDCIVVYRGVTWFCEIKDPVAANFPKYFSELSFAAKKEYVIKNHVTKGEFKFQDSLKKNKGNYMIVYDRESVLHYFKNYKDFL